MWWRSFCSQLFSFRSSKDPFILDPEHALVRYRDIDYPFAKLGFVRVSTRASLEVGGEAGELVHRVRNHVIIARPFVFFDADMVPRFKVYKIANLLNGMLAEYHQKEAVRKWLADRGVEVRVP